MHIFKFKKQITTDITFKKYLQLKSLTTEMYEDWKSKIKTLEHLPLSNLSSLAASCF